MSELGDKTFAKELVDSMETLVGQNVGNASAINRYQAKVISVDTTNHTASVYIGGSTDASAAIRVRGLQFPSANDLVMVCIDGDERWIESVVRPVGTGAYPSITLDWANNEIDLVGTVVGGGVVTETGTQTLTNKTLTAPIISTISNTGTLTLPTTTGTVALTTNKLSDFAATTSAELATVVTGETGSGALVFGTSPTLTTPSISGATNMTLDITGDVTGTAITLSGGANSFTAVVGDDTHAHTGATLSAIALGTDTTGNYVAGVTAGTNIVVSGTAGEGWSPTVTVDSSPTFTGLITGSGGAELSGAIDLNSTVSATSLAGTSNITNSQDVRIFFSTGGGLTTWRVFRDSSSERYKTNIVYMDDEDNILDVVPVTYHDKTGYEEIGEESPRQYGFLAEEMAENVDGRDYVVYNEDGSPETVQYSRLVVPLHSAMRKMRSRIDELEARLAALEAK